LISGDFHTPAARIRRLIADFIFHPVFLGASRKHGKAVHGHAPDIVRSSHADQRYRKDIGFGKVFEMDEDGAVMPTETTCAWRDMPDSRKTPVAVIDGDAVAFLPESGLACIFFLVVKAFHAQGDPSLAFAMLNDGETIAIDGLTGHDEPEIAFFDPGEHFAWIFRMPGNDRMVARRFRA